MFCRLFLCLSLLVFGVGCTHTQDGIERIPSAFTERILPDESALWKKRVPWSSKVATEGKPTTVFLGDTVGVAPPCDPPSGPEGYTADGRPGDKPWNMHMGSSAHKVIGEHYMLLYTGFEVVINHVTLKTIVGKAGGDEDRLSPSRHLRAPVTTRPHA